MQIGHTPCKTFSQRACENRPSWLFRWLFFLSLLLPQFAYSSIPQIVIHWSTLTESGNASRLLDRDGVPIDAGLPSNGDGSFATLGYFDDSNATHPFNGDWVPLTFGTTVGDSSSGYGYDDGMFSFTTVFTKDSNQVIVYPNEPATYSVNAPFAILKAFPQPGSSSASVSTIGPPPMPPPATTR